MSDWRCTKKHYLHILNLKTKPWHIYPDRSVEGKRKTLMKSSQSKSMQVAKTKDSEIVKCNEVFIFSGEETDKMAFQMASKYSNSMEEGIAAFRVVIVHSDLSQVHMRTD